MNKIMKCNSQSLQNETILEAFFVKNILKRMTKYTVAFLNILYLIVRSFRDDEYSKWRKNDNNDTIASIADWGGGVLVGYILKCERFQLLSIVQSTSIK